MAWHTQLHHVSILDRIITAVVTNSSDLVNLWISAMRPGRLVVGVSAVFMEGGRTATLQFCMAHRCLIYHIHSAAPPLIPPNLATFLLDPQVIFVGFGGLQYNVPFGRYVDLRNHADSIEELRGPASSDLTALVLHVLDSVDVVWPRPPGRWDAPDLSLEQTRYACVHAYVSHQMATLLTFGGRIPERFIIRLMIEGGPMEHIHRVPFLGQDIVTTVTNRAIVVENWIADVAYNGRLRVVGFDVEQCRFNGEPRIATAQFCVGRRCLVFQLFRMNYDTYLPNLEYFLLHENISFVGVGVEQKLRWFTHWLLLGYGGHCRGVDMGIFVSRMLRMPDLEFADPQTLLRHVFEIEVGRPRLETGWGRPTLTQAHVAYACINAAASYEIATQRLPP